MDERAEELYDLLVKYLSIRSENFGSYGNEKACAEFIYKQWSDMGLKPLIYSTCLTEHSGYLAGRGAENRPNVTARLQGKNSDSPLMLLAHTDTMPIGEASSWHTNPLGEKKDGKIYGRGANDDKCGLACLTFIAELFKETGIIPENDILITAYSDEEYGGGNGALSACINYPCAAYINLDGGNAELWNVALGGEAVALDVSANETLDSSEKIVEALYAAMDLLKPFGELRRQELQRNKVYADTDMQRSAFRITGFKAGDMGCDLCSGNLMFSLYTDSSEKQIWKELTEIQQKLEPTLKRLGLKSDGFKPISRFFHYNETVDSLGLLPRMSKAAQLAVGKAPKTAGSCLTDLNIMLKYGSMNSFNFGLVRDFMLPGGAHQPDEFVECKQLLDYAKTLALFCIGEN